jgi:hypothetical protein
MTSALKNSGFTLIEVLTATATLMMFFAALSIMVDSSLKIMGRARAEAIAATIGQSQVELANNLVYDDLGTVGGIPPGVLEPEKTQEVNGQEYIIKTDVVYIDDPFDGEAPADIVPIDYKRVRVEVNWHGVFAPRKPLVFWNDVAPKGIEQLENAGTIMLLVFDADGLAVPGASVHIEADAVSPPVNVTMATDAEGRLLLPGATVCVECYKVSVTKDGFTTDRTYGDEEVTNPHLAHLSVLEGELTQSSFTIDEVSELTIRTTKSAAWGYQPYGNMPVEIHGHKEIGRDEFDQPVYKYDQLVTTASTGQITLPNMEWDTYEMKLPDAALLQMTGMWELLPVSLRPGSTKTFSAIIQNDSQNSLMVAVFNNTDQPLGGASVRLTHSALGTDRTQITAAVGKPDQGQVYFSELEQSSIAYKVSVSLASYTTSTSSATVSGDLVERFILNPQ